MGNITTAKQGPEYDTSTILTPQFRQLSGSDDPVQADLSVPRPNSRRAAFISLCRSFEGSLVDRLRSRKKAMSAMVSIVGRRHLKLESKIEPA